MMTVKRLGDPIGAEIRGVDIRSLDDSTFSKIYQAWLDHNVIAVRDQDLTIEQFITYSRRFGRLSPHVSSITRHPDHPEVTMLGANKFAPDGTLNMKIYRRGAANFHTDGNFEDPPYKATQLYALAIPSRGGDTHFASMYSAYDNLPEKLKARLEGVYGVYTYGGKKGRSALLGSTDEEPVAVRHKLLGAHRETGRRVLYFDSLKIHHIEGMPDSESDALIQELAGYMVPNGPQYSHKWAKGDVVIWDNRCSYHKAGGDYPPEEDRIHWRISIKEPLAAQ